MDVRIQINKKKAEIKQMKDQLSAYDQQRLLAAEYLAAGDTNIPFDALDIHAKSQLLREQITALEAEVTDLQGGGAGE